jgi:hypothetical protein
MEVEQMMEPLRAIKEDLQEQMDAYQAKIDTAHEERMVKLDAHHERIMSCLGKMEATDLKANPEEMQSEVEHREVPKEEAAVKFSGAWKKRHRDRYLTEKPRGQLEEQTW